VRRSFILWDSITHQYQRIVYLRIFSCSQNFYAYVAYDKLYLKELDMVSLQRVEHFCPSQNHVLPNLVWGIRWQSFAVHGDLKHLCAWFEDVNRMVNSLVSGLVAKERLTSLLAWVDLILDAQKYQCDY
jgi:hypothetical protein